MFKNVDVVVVCPHNIVKVITFFWVNVQADE